MLFPQGLDGVLVGLSREHGLKGAWGRVHEWRLVCLSMLSGRGRGWGQTWRVSENKQSSFPTLLPFSFLSLHQAAAKLAGLRKGGG